MREYYEEVCTPVLTIACGKTHAQFARTGADLNVWIVGMCV